MNKNKKIEIPRIASLIILIIAIIFLTVFSFWAGAEYDENKNSENKIYQEQQAELEDVDFNLFWDTWKLLEDNYVDHEKLTDRTMFYGALRGIVDSLGDPYTVFMDPEMFDEFSEDMSGSFEGIGAEVGMKNGIVTIVAPLAGMPAEKAGLKSGDLVIEIDGESTANMNIMEAVRKMRGPKDTNVTLTIAREGLDQLLEITITRGTIIIKSVEYELLDNNIFLITVSNFNDDTDALFNQAVNEALISNPKGIILDLRNNPGGYLDVAVNMAGNWVDHDVVVKEDYGNNHWIDHKSDNRASLKGIPTVVLVNQGSASASEIVAGALQDHGLATIVGEPTFGKGSVQILKPLNDGSAIKITAAKWITPNGNSINDSGIMPNIEVEYTIEDFQAEKDPQMEKAVNILNK
ncbi:MAG: S41 family peptidase [bacterium]